MKGFGEGDVLSRGGYWTSRITFEHRTEKKKRNQTVSMFYYAAFDANHDMKGSKLEPTFEDPQDPSRITGISGITSSLKKFKISFVINKESALKVHQFFHTVANSKGPDQFTNDILQRLRLYSSDEKVAKPNAKNNIIGLDAQLNGNDPVNFAAIQINFKVPFTLDVVYHLEDVEDNSNQEWLMGEDYTQRVREKELMYDNRFENSFGLKEKGFDEKAVNFAQATIR